MYITNKLHHRNALYGFYSLVAKLLKLTRSFLKFCDSRIKIRTAHFLWSNLFLLHDKPSFRQTLCSDWFFVGQDFAIRTVSMETVQSVFLFCSEAGKFKIWNQNSEKKVWILSFFTLKPPEEAEKMDIFPKFQRWMKNTNIFKVKPPEVHFTIRNRVPYNKVLTNRGGGPYWGILALG